MKKTKKKLRWLQTGSIFFLFAPIIGVMAFNFKDYFSFEKGFVFSQAVEVGTGTILAGVFGVMLALGKTNVLRGNRLLILLLLLSILLKTLLNDLILILAAVTGGSLINSAFQPVILETKKIHDYERQAGIQAQALNNIVREVKAKPQKIEFDGRG